MTENRRIENKRELTDNLEKEVVGFLNSHDGGEIHIGVDDSGMVTGLDDADAIQLKVKDRLKNNIQPSIMGLFDIFLERIEEKTIVRIIVASGLEKIRHDREGLLYAHWQLYRTNGTGDDRILAQQKS